MQAFKFYGINLSHRENLLDTTKSTKLAGLVIYAIEQGIIYVVVK
jgi:hypothetical protein